MNIRLLNFLLIATSLLGYLEWGGGNRIFLFEVEAELFSKLFSDPVAVLHPFTVLPMIGQLLLVITLFQKQPGKWLTYSGIACIGLLLVFMLLIGLMSINVKLIGSTLPFLVVAILTVRELRKRSVHT